MPPANPSHLDGPRRRTPAHLLRHHFVPSAAAFLRTEAASGIVLIAALATALLWANSPVSDSYSSLWHDAADINLFGSERTLSLEEVVNDGLMTLFFFVVGLEIKRELREGELARPRHALLPVAAAIGGMAVPALLYAAFNATGDGAAGWGIPMATDIAMAAGVLALLGSRVPAGLRVFLLALAIVDDIGGILVIAVFYTDHLSMPAMGAAAALLAALVVMRLVRVRAAPVYIAVGLAFWLAVLESGVHATIAGVVLATLVSTGTREDPGESALDRTESLLHPWASFLVVPLFALANGGVEITRDSIEAARQGDIAPGILVGLVAGKPVGIVLGAFAVVFAGLAALPEHTNWRHIAGAGLLGGIGFTVSLFISSLAFSSSALDEEAKMGILAASVVAGALGYTWLRLCCKPTPEPASQ